MKMPKRFIALCLIAAFVVSVTPQEAGACDQTSGCYATLVNVTCGKVTGQEVAQHEVKESNGYTVICRITAVYGPHALSCAGCGVSLGAADRTCSETHSYKNCQNRYNLCKR